MSGSARLFRGLKAFAQGFFIGVPICLTFTDNFFTVCQVEGISMQPILNCDARRKDFVLVSRWKAKKFDQINRGDIVSIVSPKDPDVVFIKRVVALEGDTIRTLGFKNRIVKVPRGHCWIEGDNHKHSLDSNSFGSVPLGLVNGVATRIVWPPSRWSSLTTKIPSERNPFDITTELETSETKLLGDKDVGDVQKSPCTGTSDHKELLSDTDFSFDTSVARGIKKNTSNKLLKNLPQNALRHASEMASVDEKE